MNPRDDVPTPLRCRPATPDDASTLRRLWPLFQHDMSTVTGALPRPDGGWRTERLDRALAGEPGWQAWIARAADHPVGLALVRDLDQPVRVLNSFFVVAAARRHGVGRRFATEVVRSRPGRWTVAFQDANPAAASFWRAVARDHDASWTHEHRAVPDRPDLPPDSWIGFTVTHSDPDPTESGARPV